MCNKLDSYPLKLFCFDKIVTTQNMNRIFGLSKPKDPPPNLNECISNVCLIIFSIYCDSCYLFFINIYYYIYYINSLNTVDFTEETVYDKLCKLKGGKSPGVDRIYPVVLKKSCKCYFQTIESHFSQSLLCNVVPHDWKSANVTPLFKDGPRNKASSYRPVSLTSQVCKII